MATLLTTSPRSKLLYDQEEGEGDSYFSPNKSSYYKRSNLLIHTQSTSSFRQKYKGFRTRSSSYTSLDDEKKSKDDNLITSSTAPAVSGNTSIFSRKNFGMTAERRSNTAPSSHFSVNKYGFYDEEQHEYVDKDNEDDEDADENTFFAKNNKTNYSRKNLQRPTSNTSWKSSVLRAVGVKSR